MPPHSYKKPLGRSISIGCIVFVALLCLVLSLVNQATYKRGLYARYKEHIRDLLTFVQSQIDTDDLANCIKTGEKSPKYLELQKFMDTFKDNVKLQYLYVIRPLSKTPPDNVMNIIAAMSSYEKEFMPEMEVELNGLTGEEYSIECVSEYLKAAEKKEISFFSDSWVKNGVVYMMYTGSLPIFTSSGEYIGLLCVDIDITEIRKVIKESTLTNIILILILGLTFITLFIIWAHYNIAKPIQKLENSVTTFAYQHKGKEDIDSIVIEDPNIHTNNEVESLANAVVKMSKDMRVYVENVIEAESKARTMSELANKDALTCVRNKTAYDNYAENVINKQIKEGTAEFVVILKGDDFKNRKKLLTEATDVFKNTSANESANPWERLSAAIGMADFDPTGDKTLEDVFNRADKTMYKNKVAMKALREE